MRGVAIVLGGGRGTRLGVGRPKAHVCLAGRTLLEWCARALESADCVEAIQLVVADPECPLLARLQHRWDAAAPLLPPVLGGETRQASVAAAVKAVQEQAPEAEWLLVHDAARCLVAAADADAVFAAAQETGAALPVIPVTDTIKVVSSGVVQATPERSGLFAAQTPQCFRRDLLREALEKAERDAFSGTDCSVLVERLGVPVRVSRGRPENFKVTTPLDLARAEQQVAGVPPS